MTSKTSLPIRALALAWVLAGIVPAAQPHDLQTKVDYAPPHVVVRARYDGTEPASFAAVTVHAPAGAGIEADAFQTGRTDFNGNFVFLPTAPGEWRIVVDDEMGHRVTLTATVGVERLAERTGSTGQPGEAAGPANGEGRSTLDRLIVGVSVLLGATGLLYGWLARRAPRPA